MGTLGRTGTLGKRETWETLGKNGNPGKTWETSRRGCILSPKINLQIDLVLTCDD